MMFNNAESDQAPYQYGKLLPGERRPRGSTAARWKVKAISSLSRCDQLELPAGSLLMLKLYY